MKLVWLFLKDKILKNETLQDKAIVNLNAAQDLLKLKDSGDDTYINFIGYHLQQSIELFLKHYLETECGEFPFSHDIDVLLDTLLENETSIKLSEDFVDFASIFTTWEAKTRYVKNYRLARRTVLKDMKLLEELFSMNGITVNTVAEKY